MRNVRRGANNYERIGREKSMFHHFDTRLAKEDPSLTVCDLCLFQGAPGTTVMAMPQAALP
jgi:hypothetical protein